MYPPISPVVMALRSLRVGIRGRQSLRTRLEDTGARLGDQDRPRPGPHGGIGLPIWDLATCTMPSSARFPPDPVASSPWNRSINAACVPRSGLDGQGRTLLHLSWAEFHGSRLSQLAHRWYTPDAELIHQEQLPLDAPLPC